MTPVAAAWLGFVLGFAVGVVTVFAARAWRSGDAAQSCTESGTKRNKRLDRAV